MKANMEKSQTVWQKKSEIKGSQVLCLDCRAILDNQRNSNNNNNSPTNIVQHLCQLKHKRVQIITNLGQIEQKQISCSKCSLGDVFQLNVYDLPQGFLIICDDCSQKHNSFIIAKNPSNIKPSKVIQSNAINFNLFDPKKACLYLDSMQVSQNTQQKIQSVERTQAERVFPQKQNNNQNQQNQQQSQQQFLIKNSDQNSQLIGSDKAQEEIVDKFFKIQCLECKQYFDNQKAKNNQRSSIIKHLEKRNHFKVKFLFGQNFQESIIPDCFKCRKRNIFDLAICKINKEQYLLCIQCLGTNNCSIFTNNPNIARKLISVFPNEPLALKLQINPIYFDQKFKSSQVQNNNQSNLVIQNKQPEKNSQVVSKNNQQNLINSEDTSVKCLQCLNTFLNQRNKHDSVTQIVKHLKKCFHNTIEISESAKKTSLSQFNCLSCKSKNVFVLFIVQAEQYYIILCKQCINTKEIKFENQNQKSIENYSKSPIIINGAINPLLMNLTIKSKQSNQKNNEEQKQPCIIEEDFSDEDFDFSLNYPQNPQVNDLSKNVNPLNSNNKDKNQGNFSQVQSHQNEANDGVENQDQGVNDQDIELIDKKFTKSPPIQFENIQDYKDFFKKITNQEQQEIIKQMNQNSFSTNVKILSKKKQVLFNLERIQIENAPVSHLLKEGRELQVKFKNFKQKFFIQEIEDHTITAKVENPNKSFQKLKEGSIQINVEVKIKPPKSIFERINQGINQFSKLDENLQNIILGQIEKEDVKSNESLEIIYEDNLKDSNHLNQYQQKAIQSSLLQNISLIQGPPGTGKTETATELVLEILRNLKEQNKKNKILVCCPSNLATDNIANRIYEKDNKVKILRVVSMTRQRLKVSYKYQEIVLHQILKRGNASEKKTQFQQAQQLVEKADVICTTCINSVDYFIKNFEFPFVVIDEANQAIEPETLIPLQHEAKQLILIGDHKQLSPIIQNPQASKEGLKRSLFLRLVQAGLTPYFLSTQYRMHPEIRKLVSTVFYSDQLKDGVNEQDRTPVENFQWQNKKIPIQFYDIKGQEITLQDGRSYINEEEAFQVSELVTQLKNSGVREQDIGIITPYLSQSNYIKEKIKSSEILIDTTYSYQGQEKEYIIFSCVRINEFKNLGILRNPQLINVSITRAKRGLLIVGNKNHISYSSWWKKIIDYLEKLNLIIEIKKAEIENINCIDDTQIIKVIDTRFYFLNKK